MYSDGHEVDGSWVLRVYVTDLQVERSLRVKGELHIGGVMLRLVEDLGECNVLCIFSLSLSFPFSPFLFFFRRYLFSSPSLDSTWRMPRDVKYCSLTLVSHLRVQKISINSIISDK